MSSKKCWIVLTGLLSVLFLACQKDPSVWQIQNLSNGSILVIGHGGSGSKSRLPMNSLRSLNDVLGKGVDGTEMDVQLTMDNVLVLFHPQNLNDATECEGSVRNKNWSEMENCVYKPAFYTGNEKLIRADLFFGQRQDTDKRIFVFDTKIPVDADSFYVQSFAVQLNQLIKTFNLNNNALIESYSYTFLNALHQINPKLKLFIHADSYADAITVADRVPLYGITMDRLRITASEIKAAHARKLKVALFNLDSQSENLDAINMNPDYMQTDEAEFLLNALK